MHTTQRWSSTITLVAVLVSGFALLLFPTVCTCGAEMPHPHTLFELPGHHHGSSQTFRDVDQHGVTLLTPSGGATVVLSMAIIPGLLSLFTCDGRVPYALSSLPSPPGRDDEPDAPPPRPLDAPVPWQADDRMEEALCGFFAS